MNNDCLEADVAPAASDRSDPAALRVLVVDDNLGFAGALREILGSWEGVQVQALAHDGRAALDCAARLRPDLVLMDIAMPGLDGLSAARRMQAWPERPWIVLMSLSDGVAYRAAVAALGDVGFVGKGDIFVELAPMVAHMVAARLAGSGPQDRPSGA